MTDKLPPDTAMLDFLQEATEEGNLWVCRKSITGRGIRVHEVPPKETPPSVAEAFGWHIRATVREAIAAAMKKEKKGE